ncbi:MAG: ABC transporter substrate-binding protein [Deltaproteobacteria bacterium]|nr:ABC transporter substrate-binding protein [Deltaproteobacteria bacterium]
MKAIRPLEKSIICIVMLGLAIFMLPSGRAQGIEKVSFQHPWMVFGEQNFPDKPVRGGYYRTAAAKHVGLMNPNHWPVNDWNVITYLYEEIYFNDGDLKPSVPWLAESHEYTDPTTVIMKLREGIRFHDGTEFNAESVKVQIEWIMNKKNGCWTKAWLEPIESVEVIDAYTVKWNFKHPWAAFFGTLANIPGYMMSTKALQAEEALKKLKMLKKRIKTYKKKVKKKGRKSDRKKLAKAEKEHRKWQARAEGAHSLDTHPIGTGQYILEDSSPGNYTRLKRNPDWWFGQAIGHPDMPYFDGKEVLVIPDPSVQLANLRVAKIHEMTVDKSMVRLLKDDPQFNMYTYPSAHVQLLVFNHAKGPCRDIRVRKAISHAIDRKALIWGTQFGLGRAASCLFPDNHWSHNQELKPVSYDPALSRKLLAEAGFADGLTIKGGMGSSVRESVLTEAVKGMLSKVGIDWEVNLLDAAAAADKMRNLEYDVGGARWEYIYDPDASLTGLYHPNGGFNYGRSRNKRVISLIEAGRRELIPSKRQKIYRTLEKEIYENYEDAWLWWEIEAIARSKKVLGINQELYLLGRESYYMSHPMWFKDGRSK